MSQLIHEMVSTKSLCRICAQLEEECYLIFDNTNMRDIELKINKCLSITVNPNDNKPKEICSCCYIKLNEFFEFYEMCRSSNNSFEKQTTELNRIIANNGRTNNDHIVEVKNPELNCSGDIEVSNLKTSEISKNNCSGGNNNQTVLRHSSDFYKTIQTCVNNSIVLNKDVYNENDQLNCTSSTNNKHTCQHCKKSFTRKSSLTVHLSLHATSKPFSCNMCDKTFANHRLLRVHQVLHTKKYACGICAKSFYGPSKLQRHIRTHTKQRPFVCSVVGCGKSFVDNSNLRGHEVTHSNEKLFTCPVCSKSCRTSSQLKEHGNVHCDFSCFVCNVCGKKYRWKSNLVVHNRKHV